MQVTPEEIALVARLVKEMCGVALDQSKGYLIDSRLSRLAEAAGCRTFHDLVQKARLPAGASLRNEIIDAITTQETLFFRDNSPFDALRHKALPDLIDAKTRARAPKRLRFWSAACSTGQEVYSLAMTLSELLPDLASWDVNILGTDISNAAVRLASRGQYSEHEIQRGMTSPFLSRYFTAEGGGWKVKDELRWMVAFARRNLLEPLTDLGPFDVIFCRNVAIYFDAAARAGLFHRLAERLTPEGYLFVGSSESLGDLGPQFAPQYHCRATFYQPAKRPPAAAVAPAAKLPAPVKR